MLLFVMTGEPCTGKSTTAYSMYEFLKDHGNQATLIKNSSRDAADLEVYRWVIENINTDTSAIAVVDGGHLNVFDRANLLKQIDDALSQMDAQGDEIIIIAVQHDRSRKFIFEANNAKERHAYDTKRLRSLMNITQQPIKREGFDMIYRITQDAYIDPNRVFNVVSKEFEVNIAGLSDTNQMKNYEPPVENADD